MSICKPQKRQLTKSKQRKKKSFGITCLFLEEVRMNCIEKLKNSNKVLSMQLNLQDEFFKEQLPTFFRK